MDEQATAAERAATEIKRLRDKVTGLEVAVNTLDRDRRRARSFGPALLIALATVTPLVSVTPRGDPQKTFTLWQAARGGTADGGLASTWFVALALLMLVTFCACFALLGRQPAKGLVALVATSATLLIVSVIALALGLATKGTSSTAINGLQVGSLLAVAAGCWLLISCAWAQD